MTEKQSNIKDYLYIIGLTLIIVGFLVCLLPYCVIFGGPVFLIGVLLLWFSRKTVRHKLLWTFIPLIVWYPAMGLFVYFGSNHVTPATYLIPRDFRGKIQIIYGEPCGQRLQMVDNRKIFIIPDNGVLIVQDELETGFINNEYYFVDKGGNKLQKIDELIRQSFNEEYTTTKNKKEPPRNKVALFFGGTGGVVYAGEREQSYEFMFVMSYDSLRVFKESHSDSLARSLVNTCRGRSVINSEQKKPSR